MSKPPETSIDLVPGTRDALATDTALLDTLQRDLLRHFRNACYEPIRTPILEFSDLHERKSGAGIVARLFELADDRMGALCLRPELTASIVRAYVGMPEAPPLPFRVCAAGPVFRNETLRPSVLREFTQVGVELLGTGGPAADAEVIAIAESALHGPTIQVRDATVRIGHLGLILEILSGSGLPLGARAALIEILSEAADGHQVSALDAALDRLVAWLRGDDEAAREILPSVQADADLGVDRLFRQLVPDVTGRRSGHEIIGRLRKKWDLGHTLQDAIAHLRNHIHIIENMQGDAQAVLERLRAQYAELAPRSVAELAELVRLLGVYGIAPERIRLQPGFSRGIGFYTQMIFAIEVGTSAGSLEVCGGGRYDGLARVFGSDRDARGAGFAFGLERLATLLHPKARAEAAAQSRGHFIVPLAPEWTDETVRLANFLRSKDFAAETHPDADRDAAIAAARSRRREFIVFVGGPYASPGSLMHCRTQNTESIHAVTLAQLAPELPE